MRACPAWRRVLTLSSSSEPQFVKRSPGQSSNRSQRFVCQTMALCSNQMIAPRRPLPMGIPRMGSSGGVL